MTVKTDNKNILHTQKIAYMLGNLIMKSKFALICDIFSEIVSKLN